jgi:hypothetical protein
MIGDRLKTAVGRADKEQGEVDFMVEGGKIRNGEKERKVEKRKERR